MPYRDVAECHVHGNVGDKACEICGATRCIGCDAGARCVVCRGQARRRGWGRVLLALVVIAPFALILSVTRALSTPIVVPPELVFARMRVWMNLAPVRDALTPPKK